MTYWDDSKYEGEWQDGAWHGHGTHTGRPVNAFPPAEDDGGVGDVEEDEDNEDVEEDEDGEGVVNEPKKYVGEV